MQTPVPAHPLYNACRTVCRVVSTVFFDLKVLGLENVPSTGGVLLLSNHQSYLDPVVIATQLRRPLSFLSKAELFENKIFGAIITYLNAYPIRQGAGDVGAMRETIRRLQEGKALVVFPEGTRTPDGNLQPLQPGFALVVRKSGVPIIPVAIEGAFKAWRPGSRKIYTCPIRVQFGPAIDVGGMRAGEIVTVVDEKLRKLISELRAHPSFHREMP